MNFSFVSDVIGIDSMITKPKLRRPKFRLDIARFNRLFATIIHRNLVKRGIAGTVASPSKLDLQQDQCNASQPTQTERHLESNEDNGSECDGTNCHSIRKCSITSKSGTEQPLIDETVQQSTPPKLNPIVPGLFPPMDITDKNQFMLFEVLPVNPVHSNDREMGNHCK